MLIKGKWTKRKHTYIQSDKLVELFNKSYKGIQRKDVKVIMVCETKTALAERRATTIKALTP